MIIKPDKTRFCQIPLMIIMLIVLVIVDMRLFPISIGMIIYIILDSIVTGKTIIMDRAGCSLKLFSYERKYKWEEVVVRRKEKYSNNKRIYPHEEAMFFSVIPVKKPKWMGPLIYCCLRHPFRCFFVYLEEKETVDYIQSGKFMLHTGERFYVVEKEQFLGKLKEWDVNFTE